jgi:hypothetical protein
LGILLFLHNLICHLYPRHIASIGRLFHYSFQYDHYAEDGYRFSIQCFHRLNGPAVVCWGNKVCENKEIEMNKTGSRKIFMNPALTPCPLLLRRTLQLHQVYLSFSQIIVYTMLSSSAARRTGA